MHAPWQVTGPPAQACSEADIVLEDTQQTGINCSRAQTNPAMADPGQAATPSLNSWVNPGGKLNTYQWHFMHFSVFDL